MLNPRLTRLQLPGRREQYDGLIQFAISAAVQAMASQFHTASRLPVESAAMWTDRKSAELLGEQLGRLVSGIAGGEYYKCWQAMPREEYEEGTRKGGSAPDKSSPK
jgi:hypothetical protein